MKSAAKLSVTLALVLLMLGAKAQVKIVRMHNIHSAMHLPRFLI